MQKEFRIPEAYSDEKQFFESGISAVSITSPAPFHKQNAIAAVQRGLPVLCEKPLAMTAGDAEEMIHEAAKAGVSLYTAFCYRFSPSALKIRELIQRGEIGDVKTMRLIYNWHLHGKFMRNSDGEQIISPRWEGRMLEGGPMVDCGTHQIDLARFWLDSDIKRYSSHGSNLLYSTPRNHCRYCRGSSRSGGLLVRTARVNGARSCVAAAVRGAFAFLSSRGMVWSVPSSFSCGYAGAV